jgi:hypothetical protein
VGEEDLDRSVRTIRGSHDRRLRRWTSHPRHTPPNIGSG